MRFVRSVLVVGVLLWLAKSASAALFSDDFNADTSGNYNIALSSADTNVTFGFDYSALGIGAAPNTGDGTTLGLKMEANISAPTGAEGVTLHTNQTFTGQYQVRFDAWINANGPFPGGGGGSTEFLTAGVGGSGAVLNLGGSSGSGGWTAVTGEGGSSRDYRMYKDGNEQFAESGQFAAGNSSTGGGAHNGSDPYYAQFGNVDVSTLGQGGSQTGTTSTGSFGFEWHEVSILVNNGTANWTIDGLNIGTLDPNTGSAFSTDGSVTIGYMDIFTSVSDAPQFSFGVVDNLSVTAVPEPSSLLFGFAASALGLAYRRRRR